MSDTLAEQIAASLDATVDMLPYIPELLADCPELGTSAAEIVELLRPLDVDANAVLVDIGCGKGTAAIRCAAELRCRVVGVDAFAPFIAEATRQARLQGLGRRCAFVHGDWAVCTRGIHGADIVVFNSCGPSIGGEACMAVLRRCVRPGGHIVIDDGYLPDGCPADVPSGYEDYVGYDDMRARLTACGDTIVREILQPAGLRDEEARITAAIERRAADLSRKHPHEADLFRSYVHRQEQACADLERFHVPATWLIRRAG